MKIQISEYCIRCGICEDLYPDMFKRNYEDHCMDILVDELEKDQLDRAKAAAADCAVAAISIR